MDPRHPSARLETVLADSGAKFILVASDLKLPTTAHAIDPFQQQTRFVTSRDPISAPVGPSSLAYVIYTSGSTGNPKGVAIEHGALVNLLRSMQRTPGLTADDVLVAVTTLAFDIAALELLLPLLTGAKLVIATDCGSHRRPPSCSHCLTARKLPCCRPPPAPGGMLIDAGWALTSQSSLKALCGGEALPRDLADRMLKRRFDRSGIMYGPTETTIWSTATRVLPGTGPLAHRPTHRQHAGLRAGPEPAAAARRRHRRALHRRRRPRPRLLGTAQADRAKVRPEPLRRRSHVRHRRPCALRRTTARCELLGRADFQVKIRGYRIELAEIEMAMLTVRGVN